MKLYSTSNRNINYTLEDAVMQGIAPDGGLFMPCHIPALPSPFIRQLSKHSFPDICLTVTKALIGKSLPLNEIRSIVERSITFPAPIIRLSDTIYSLELWHGPSLAFKDFGAQFMANLMSYFNRNNPTPLHILVATSGDTGGAVAAGFHKVPGINVIILFPKGKVSLLQEQQLTTFGDNVTAVEIEGTFDDCQTLVKCAFADPSLRRILRLTSANSINIARLIPQMFYYFEGYKQLPTHSNKAIFSVPSGNFGNLTAGLMAKKMGLPVSKFIASTNINDVVPQYLHSGTYNPKPSVETLSNAMDVGNPSNFIRILDLYSSTWNNITSDIIGYSFDDTATLESIRMIYNRHHYIADPHSAIAYLGLVRYQDSTNNHPGIFLATAHPSKFKSTLDIALGQETTIHPKLEQLSHLPSTKTTLANNYALLHQLLLDLFH